MPSFVFGRTIILALVLASLPAKALAQSLPTPSVARDPQAISILTQSLSAAGGLTAIEAIQDFTETGRVTYYWDQSAQGPIVVRGRGTRQFRVDATLADGVHSWFVNSSRSFRRNPDGSALPLPSQNIVKLAATTFPLLQTLTALQDNSVNISYGGLVTHNGEQVHDILVQRMFPHSSDPLGALSKVTKAHIFIDPNTLMIQSVVDTAYRPDGGPGEFPHEVRFSNYQAANGVLVPFSVTELIANQQTETIQLKQVTFNTSLTDSDFD